MQARRCEGPHAFAVTGTRVEYCTYDDNGNTVEDGTQAVEFNMANRAVSFGPSLLDLPTLTRQYNALGQRVAEVRLPGAPLAVKTHYRYDPQGNLLAERIAGVQTRTYVHLEGRPLATWSIPSDPVTEDDLGEPALYYYHTDRLGTPRMMTDASGAIAWDADYSPFGEASIRTEEVVNHLRFPGQYDSPETGLHYNYFRDYDSRSGRYVESDPIGLSGGSNLFAYALGNPINRLDRFGLDPNEPGDDGSVIEGFREAARRARDAALDKAVDVLLGGRNKMAVCEEKKRACVAQNCPAPNLRHLKPRAFLRPVWS